jgi:hypothetical protein
MTVVPLLSWLALLCRRRSGLIVELLTLRYEIAVLRRQITTSTPSGCTDSTCCS